MSALRQDITITIQRYSCLDTCTGSAKEWACQQPSMDGWAEGSLLVTVEIFATDKFSVRGNHCLQLQIYWETYQVPMESFNPMSHKWPWLYKVGHKTKPKIMNSMNATEEQRWEPWEEGLDRDGREIRQCLIRYSIAENKQHG